MLGVAICIAGVVAILLVAELLWRQNILRGELQRKFVHIVGGVFVAFWPWLISWETIQLIGLVLLAGVIANRFKQISHFRGNVHRVTYGDIFSPLAIISCAMLTTTPLFFTIAILHLALADGLAAVIGTSFGKKTAYKVFGQRKTIIGTMTFWISSLVIVGFYLPLASDAVLFEHYSLLLVVLPPFLAALENLSVYGSDNITVPLAALVVLENIHYL